MDDELPSIRIPTEEFMDEASASTPGSRRNEDIALDLMNGDDLELERGRRYEHVVSVTRHDGSRTIDCQFESGRRGTFQYKADLMIAAH